MTIHFHVGKMPVTLAIGKRSDLKKLLEEYQGALLWYGLTFEKAGDRARYVLRRWAGGGAA
jgi:hypothetical protein